MKKLCVVTGSRAEYGLLKPLLEKIKEDEEVELQLVVTGMHMDYTCGLTYRDIEKDGFDIDAKVEMNIASDTATGICKSMSLGLLGISDALSRLKPDLIILLGDRYEIMTAAIAAMIHKIPIAHIHGGELSLGAYDDSIRHAITKMSYLHFTSTEDYKRRVIQLGEEPDRVFNVGALGIEVMRKMPLLSQKSVDEIIGFFTKIPYAIVTFHPVTLEDDESLNTQVVPLLEALDEFLDLPVIFTGTNADAGGKMINDSILEYVKKRKNAAFFHSLGSLKYLSLMKYSAVVIGNSSSGIIEAPYFKVPSVNIGDRQTGRVKPESVIDCNNKKEDIMNAIKTAISYKWDNENYINPYEDDNTSQKIITEIKQALRNKVNLKKTFFDWK